MATLLPSDTYDKKYEYQMFVRIINKSENDLPEYQTPDSAGMDLRAFLDQEMMLKPMERALIPTGIHLEIPDGFEGQIRPRSGLAYRHGITILNAPGTIDSDYRGEIKVLLINFSEQEYILKNGDRIAQLLISPYAKVAWEEVSVLRNTFRGANGYGSTGI